MSYLKSIYSKFISFVLILTIGATTSAYGSANPALFTRKSHAQRYLKEPDKKSPLNFADKDPLLAISIPRNLGIIAERYKGESDYTVIHIQDSHINPAAQFNIVKIIEQIATKHDISLMCLEGASTELDTSFYDKFPDDEAKHRVAGFFVKRNLFTGAEFYKILHKNQYLKTIGVEDKEAYLEHLFCHRKNRLSREAISGFLEELERGLIRLKAKVYSKDLKDLSGKSCLYHLKQIKLPKYLKTLEEYSKETKIDISKYVNLVKMLALIAKEKGVDFQAAATEREALVLYLSELLPAKELRELSVMSLNFKLDKRSDIEFYAYLEQFLHNQLLAVNNEIRAMGYNHLIAYIDYLKFSKSIDYLMVYDEAERLEEEALKALCANSTQQRLVEYTKAVSIMRDFCELKLTSGRLDYMDRNQDYFDIENIKQFLKEACNEYGLPLEDALFVSIDKMLIENTKNFYEIALKRDIAITENTLKSMKRQRKEKAILITGGFHTRGITNILKEKGISYVVICPNIGLINSERLYLDRLAGRLQDVSELTELFSQTLTAPLVTGDASVAEVSSAAQKAFEMCWNISNNVEKPNTPARKAEEIARQINSRSIKIYPYNKKNNAYALDKGGVLKAIYDPDYPMVVRFMIEGISDYVILGFRVDENGISALSTHFPDNLQGKKLNSQVFEALGNVVEKGATLKTKIYNPETRKRLFNTFEVVAGSIKKRGAGDNIIVDENLISDVFSKTLMGNLFAMAGFDNFKLMFKRDNGSYMRGLEALANILLASIDGEKTGEFHLEAVKLYNSQPGSPHAKDGKRAEPVKSSSAGTGEESGSGLLDELASIDSMQATLPFKWMETISPSDIVEPFKNIQGIELEAEKFLKVKLLWHIVCHTLEIEGKPLKPFFELEILDISEESIAGHSAEFSYYLRLMIEEKMGKEIKAEIEKTLEEKNVKAREGLIEEWDKAVDSLLEEHINSIPLLLDEIEAEFKRQDLFEEIEEAMEHFRERFSYVLVKTSSAGRETGDKKNESVADFSPRITKEMIQAVVDGSQFRSRKNGKDYEIKTAVEGDLLVIWVKADGQPDELNRDEHSYIELGFEFLKNKNKVEILIDRESIKEPGSRILTSILDKIAPHFEEITYVSTNQCPQIIVGAEKTIENILRKSNRKFKVVENNFGGIFYINKPKPFNSRIKKSKKERPSAMKSSSAGQGGVGPAARKESSLLMERREFLKWLSGTSVFLTALGAGKREASAQNNIFEDPRDLILNFGQAIDNTVLEKYISVIKKQKLLEFSSVIQNDYDTTIIVKLGESRVDAEVIAGRLNRALSGKISFAKKFKCVKSSIMWEETKTYKEIENFVGRVANISDALGMGRLNTDNLGTLLEGVTYVESKYLHWERSFGKIKPIESYTGAIGATQLVKSKAVKHIAELVFKHRGGLVNYSNIILELKRVLEQENPKDNYLSAYFEAGDDPVLQRYAVEKLRRKILANPLLEGVNLYYALSIWLILVENKKISTTLKIDRKIIEQIADIAQSAGNVWSGEGAYKPQNLHEAECRCRQDLLRAEVIFRVLGEEIIKDIAVKYKTNSKRFEALFNYMKKKVYDDKSYNQKVGYVYLFYLWDRGRRLELKKREQGYVFTEELPEYFEFNSRGFDERLAAAAAYNSGWRTVSRALRGFGAEKDKGTIPGWIKNMIGPNRRNPREPINYLRTYLEYTLHYKNVLAEKDYNLMCALIEERYNRLRYVVTKRGPRLIEYSKIITSDGQKRYAKPKRSGNDPFNHKLASLLASLLGSDYVDSYIISWGMAGWEDNILSSTTPTFRWLAKRMYSEEGIYYKKGQQVLDYFRKNKKQYGKSLTALEGSISASIKHKESQMVLQKKIKAEAKRQKARGYLIWGLKHAMLVFSAGLVSAALGYIIHRRIKRAKAFKGAEAAKMLKPDERQVTGKSQSLYKSRVTGKAYLGKAFVSDKEQKRTVKKSGKEHPPVMKSSSSGENRNEIIAEMPAIKQAGISGQQLSSQASELEKLCVDMFNFPYDLQFGYSPYRYGIIIDEAVLEGEEKRIIEFLASQKTSNKKPKFIILINTKNAKESIIDKWGLLQENILSIDKFFKQRGADLSELGSEQDKIIQAARLLKSRISQNQPIGVIAGPSVDIEKMAHSIQREKIKGVFISSQQPAATRIDRGKTSIITDFMFEALLADILLKLKSYNPARKYTIQELIEILPPITSIEFIEKIKLLKAATEAISQAA